MNSGTALNQITLLFFATLKDRAGVAKTTFTLPESASVGDLKEMLAEKYPDLGPALVSVLVAIDREYAFDQDLVPAGAEVALFPPVSGGGKSADFLEVTGDPLDLDGLLDRITTPTTGAACFFSGMVRADTRRDDPHQTDYLEYETYEAMAVEKMQQVAYEIRAHWPAVEGIAIVQRIGRLYPGTPTVLIACSAAHRDSGVFEAARYGIDRLKEIVPIWKKEVGPQGETWIEGSYVPKPGD